MSCFQEEKCAVGFEYPEWEGRENVSKAIIWMIQT